MCFERSAILLCHRVVLGSLVENLLFSLVALVLFCSENLHHNVTLLFSVNDRILREICESQTSVISVPDLALADRLIYRARELKTHKGRHKTRAIKVT